MRRKRSLPVLAYLALAAAPASAALRLGSPLSEHMVLQQGVPVPIWGSGCPGGDSVAVYFDGQTVRAKSDWAGRWSVQLAPMKAGGPYQLLIDVGGGGGPFVPSPAANSHDFIELNDVLVGEVWLVAGRSGKDVSAGYRGDPGTRYPWVRMFKTPPRTAADPQTEVAGRWTGINADTVPQYPATAYSFAHELYDKLKVPIGLIDSSYAGGPPEAWTSGHALAADPELRVLLARYQAGKSDAPAPSTLYNAMIAPLAHYPIRGAVWIEDNLSHPVSEPHTRLVRALLADWRSAWGSGELPFLYAPAPGSEAQEKPPGPAPAHFGTARIAAGGSSDPTSLTYQQELGRNLAFLGWKLAYGESVP